MFTRRTCTFVGQLTVNSITLRRPRLLLGPIYQPHELNGYRLRALTLSRHNNQKVPDSQAPMSAMRLIWNKLFGKYLLVTNIISSGLLMVIGDVAAQELELRRENSTHIVNVEFVEERYNYRRIWRMFLVGALQGPLHHYVYNWMDRIMPVANLRNITKKILIDQLFMSPICIFIFFYSACYLERKSLKETNCELGEKFGLIYLIDWLVWPGAQYINFRYLDTKYRVMFVNVCTALYNVFLSYMKHDFIS